MLFYLFMSPNLLRLSVIQKICENWSTTAGKAKRRFDPQTLTPKLNTVIMLAITSTMKFGELPGNVILRKSEANLPKKCVINITQIKSVDKTSIKEKIATLSKRKMDEVYEGLKLVLTIPPQ